MIIRRVSPFRVRMSKFPEIQAGFSCKNVRMCDIFGHMSKLDLYSFESSEFDYRYLLSKLGAYRQPRKKISELLKRQEIVRVKKGLYVLGPKFRKPYSIEILAGLVWGPSYISKEFALSHYGLIPEAVHVVTCMTAKRSRTFNTPVAVFQYESLPKSKYSIGITLQKLDQKRAYLLASREKALVDMIYKKKNLDSLEEMRMFVNGLRLNPREIAKIKRENIVKINDKYKSTRVMNLARIVAEIQKGFVK